MANRYMLPSNAHTVSKIFFVPYFKTLKVGWQYNTLMCKGVEKFVEEFLPIIRKNNPHVKFVLHRHHTPADPFIVGEYEWNRHRAKRVGWRTELQILSMVEEFAVGGDYRSGKRRGVKTILPRGQELWNTETMGHDVFKVASKYKYDENVDEKLPKSVDHPHFIYKKFH
ncbi:Ribosomal protein/NADH dehydrogenase domain and Thioredoxin-like fold domain-containing protein [Strongyloides ratti]|uniref:Ribosomal protein/NADH dehydrogenase domain and Thioredoxin-like fold domain-containing protein n=1 Tax=Strongyloides ratti TaxID=34506 RepID=A0A090L7W2_STRRB|nr:Ribosomal protein/NADH dehydrogenase domain and Thioredoxin-like fold domain-containing protein [Strongyloides ratti]CEF64183.1 Ribosomal protein/NADH dehydrogenase domain and Thioredoxin-like fold domain-containing protein [Strongyloides ratti]